MLCILAILMAACSRPASQRPASQQPTYQQPTSERATSVRPASQQPTLEQTALERTAPQQTTFFAPTESATQAVSRVVIDQVQVQAGAGIYVQGHSTLPNGECVKTELLDAQQPVAWWPKDVCVEVDAGQWELLAALGKGGAPEALNPKGHYTLHAWWPKQPQQSSASFSIDLATPAPAQ